MQKIKKNLSKTNITLIAIIVSLITMIIVSNTYNSSPINDNFGIKGYVTVRINGHVVTQNDAIYSGAYNYIMCDVYYNLGACTAAGIILTTTVTTTETLPVINFPLTGLVLSSVTQTNFACNGQISGSGLSGQVATQSYSISTNQIVLSASWTATSTINAINSICLFPVSPPSTLITAIPAIAYENFVSQQSLSSGQSISVSWTFSF